MTPVRDPAPADLTYFARRAGPNLPAPLGATSDFVDDADDTEVPVGLGWSTPMDWVGTVTASSPILQNLDFPATQASCNLAGSTFTVTLQSRTDTGPSPNYLTVDANALGQCVMLSLNSQGWPGTVTGSALSGPFMTLQNGLNALPTGNNTTCPS